MSEALSRWSRATAEPDMWIDPDDDPREQQPAGTDERSILIDYLRRYRLTMQLKCAPADCNYRPRSRPGRQFGGIRAGGDEQIPQ